MKKFYILILLVLMKLMAHSQVINVTGVSVSGRFNSCSGNNTPVVTATLISTSGGASVSGGLFTCLNPCDSSTIRVNLSNVRWNKNPNAEWLHGLFLPSNAGFSVSPIFIPNGFITYNAGCIGMCPSGSGANGGPGFYFDATSQNSCCGTITANDGFPCNNYGDVTISCSSPLSLTFDLTFCNSIITSGSYQFVFTGSSDGETGCYNYIDTQQHKVTFTIPTVPCTMPSLNAVAGAPVRSCVAGVENYTSTLTATCSGNSVHWWDAPTGGNLLGTGSPFVYDPAGSVCPTGTTLYATCCSGVSTTCVQRVPVTIPGSCNPLTISGVTTTNTVCSTLASINSVSVLYSQGTVNYTLTPGGITNTTGVFTGLNQTAYTVTVSDASGCTASTAITLVQVPVLSLSTPTVTNVSCSGPNTGQIMVTASGGTGAITLSINPTYPQTLPGVFPNLPAQTYTITATDITNCSVSTVVTITSPPVPTFTSVVSGNITCNGLNNGTITATATGGSGALTYTLNPGGVINSTGAFSSISAGTYTVKASDASGCSVTSVVTISNPPLLSWTSVSAASTVCSYLNNGSITAAANGGTGIKTYQLLPVGTSNTTGSFPNLTAGTYTVKATDANGCSITSAITVLMAPAIVMNTPVIVSPLCNGGNNGSISVTATGGVGSLGYSLTPGSITNTTGSFPNLTAGTYTVTVTDGNACTKTTIATITQPIAIQFNSVVGVNPLCNSTSTGSITANASGGTGTITYLLQPGAVTNTTGVFNSVGMNTYTVKATDANGCSVTSIISIAQPTALSWSTVTKTNVLCNGGNTGTINTTASGGTGTITYLLQPGATTNTTGTFGTLTAQTYTVKATDANGCSITTAVIITQPTVLAWSTVTGTNVACNGGNNGAISSVATGGTGTITYLLQPGATTNTTGTFGTLTAQTYTVKATDANGCSITSAVNITQPTVLQITNITSTIPSCVPGNDATLTVTATGGTSSYQYSKGGPNQASNIFTSMGSGTYTITVTDAHGCAATSVFTITTPNSPTIATATKTNVSCNGGNNGTINVTASGGTGAITYQLQPGAISNATGAFGTLTAQTYTVKATDAVGCSVTTVLIVTQPTALSWSTVTKTNVLCNGGNTATINATATGGTGTITYLLQPGATTNTTGTFGTLIAQTYTVKATDANGCSITTAVTITQPTVLAWTTVTSTNVACNGGNNGAISSTATGGTGTITYLLQPGATTNTTGTFGTLTAQTYTVKATDANGCSITSAVNITQPTVLQITNITSTIPSCVPGNDATLTVTATGGTSSYQYSKGGPNQASNIFTSMGSGTYTMTVTDAHGCTATSVFSITTPNSPTIATATKTNVSCNGGNNGTINVTATGGTGAITYQLQPGAISNATGAFGTLTAQTYTVKATDAVGCSVTTILIITQPTALSWSTVTKTNVLCNGGNTGTINESATGGTGTITYLLQPIGTTNTTGTFGTLTAQTYTVKATDANGCSITTAITITQPPLFVWNTTTSTNVSCNGGNDGTINSTATGGAGTISYTLQPGAITNTTGSFGSLTAQAYTVTAKDTNNCLITTTFNITQPTVLQITNITSTIPSCVPGNDATLTVTATGGTTTYQYSIGGANQASNIFTSMGSGMYTITVTDAHGCTATSVFSITTPNSPTIATATKTNVSCNGGNTGTINVTSTGGTGAITYQLQPGAISNATGTFGTLTAQTYTVKATDAVGCSVTTVLIITQPTALSWSTVTKTNVLCNGGNTGTINATASGGTGTITYLLQPIGTTNSTGTFGTLTAQTYTVKATDANGCSISTAITITQPPLLVWNTTTSTNVSCNGGNDGTINSTASGGAGTISYTLQPGAITNTTGSFGSLTAQAYTVTAKDTNNCLITTTFNITQPTVLQITNITSTIPSCVPGNDATLTVTATGGTTSYQYSKGGPNQASNIFTSMGSGTYTITVTDAHGCTATSVFSITTPNSPTIATATKTNVSCNGGNNGTIDVTATGGTGAITYQLQPGAISNATGAFGTLTAQTYTVKATDAVGCSVTTVLIITQPPLLTWSGVVTANVLCNGGNTGTINATASGGTGTITYLLQPIGTTNTTGTFGTLTAQTYSITATDANGCSITTSITITQPPLLVWNTTTSTNVNCNGGNDGTITATATGGAGTISYTLQPGAITNTTGSFGSLTAQSYTVTAKDTNNCLITTTFNITQPTVLQITNITSTIPSCVPGNDATLTVTATGGTTSYQYSIGGVNQSSNIFNGLGSGTFTITVTDAHGCTVTSSFTITTPNSPTISSSNQTNVSCNGGNNGTINVTATGGTGAITYQLQPGAISNATGSFGTLTAASYTVIATDASGCSVSTILVITEPTQVVWDSISSTNVLCNGGNDGTINATAIGGTGIISYTLQPGATTNTSGVFGSLTAQTYSITATDANGCSITTAITITQPPLLVWNTTTSTNVNCNGGNDGTINATATGGAGTITYTLQPGAITNTTGNFGSLTAQAYTVTAKDTNNCLITTTFNITQPTPLQITNITSTIPSCVPGNDATLTVTATGGTTSYQYSIGGANQSSNIFNGLGSGTFTITVTDANSCTVTSSFTITTPNSPTISTSNQTNVSCNGGNNGTINVTATGGTGAITYELQPGAISNATGSFSTLTADSYTVIATDASGCSVSTILLITEPTQVIWDSISSTNVLCNGGNTGTINATATGGTGIISYTIQPGASTNTSGVFGSLTAQTYSITATDANGCSITTAITITQPPLLVWNTTTSTNVGCNGGNDGTINATATGGAGTISYTLQPGAITNTTGNFGSLTAQAYTVTAKDTNNCLITTTFNITQPTPLQINNITSTIPSCVPGNDATLTVTATGGTTSYQYSIGGASQSSNVFNGLGSGTFTITVTDAHGCTVTSSFTITTPNSPTIVSLTPTGASCFPGNDGSITVVGSGGTGAYTYSIDGTNYQTSSVFTSLGAATYTVTIKDASGCTGTSVVDVLTLASPSITSIQTTLASCVPGCDAVATMTASGGVSGSFTYSLDGTNYQTSPIFNALCTGTYTATVKDGNGCTATSVFSILTANGPSIDSSSAVNILCFGGNNGSIQIHLHGGTGIITYVLQPGSLSNTTGIFISLTANTYTIVATDINGCSASTSIQLIEPPLLQFDSVAASGTLCSGSNNGSLDAPTIGGSGAINYQILPAATFVPPYSFINLVGSTTYTITATDANNCAITTTVYISQALAINIVSTTHTDVTCHAANDATINVNATGGTGTLTYSLQPSGASNLTGSFTNLAGNLYTVTITDANGCTSTTAVSVYEPPAITLSSLIATNITCHNLIDGKISIQCAGGTGALSYTLQPGGITNASGIFTTLNANTYTLVVTDATNCTYSTTAIIVNPPALQFDSVIVTNALCFGDSNGTVHIYAQGGTGAYSYSVTPLSLSNTTGIFNSLPALTYTLSVADSNNCMIDTSIEIAQPNAIIGSVLGTQNVTCYGGSNGSLSVGATGGMPSFMYYLTPGLISNTSGIFTNLTAGSYTVQVVDANGCSTFISSISISQPPQLQWTNLLHQDISCYGDTSGTITVNAIGGSGIIQYALLPANGTQVSPGNFQHLLSAVYTVIATDASGCTLTTTIEILQNPEIIFTRIDFKEPKCFGDRDGSIMTDAVGGVSPLVFSLNGTSSGTTAYFAGLISGTYTLSVVDALGCRKDTVVFLDQPDIVTSASVDITPISCNSINNGAVHIHGTGGTGYLTYYMLPGLHINRTGIFNNLPVGTYSLTIKDSVGCTFDSLITVPSSSNTLSIDIKKQDLSCFGTGNEAYAEVEIINGTPPFSYEWLTTPKQYTQSIHNIGFGYYFVHVTDANGCEDRDTVYIEPGNCCEQVFIPNAFSPNGDGVNDEFKVTTSAGIELIQFAVYDRWGNKVWSTNDYHDAWNGYYNNKLEDMATFYYIFWYTCTTDKQKYMRKGDVMLVR